MKFNCINTIWASSVIILIASCSSQPERQTVEGQPITNSTVIEQPVQAKSTQEVYISSQSNESIATINLSGKDTNLKIRGQEFFGELKSEEKRKYYDNANAMQYAVKYSDKGFKLRDSEEKLLWKVKVEEEYLKISDNEEMTNPYRIGWSSSDKIKLKRKDEELAALRFNSSSSSVSVGEKYQVVNMGKSLGLGVFLMNELKETEQIIISSELLRMNK